MTQETINWLLLGGMALVLALVLELRGKVAGLLTREELRSLIRESLAGQPAAPTVAFNGPTEAGAITAGDVARLRTQARL